MKEELPPYISMVDMLESDYNANYEAWKAKFYTDNMTSAKPLSIADIVAIGVKNSYRKRGAEIENKIIMLCLWFLLITGVVFWLIPGVALSGDAKRMNDLGTLDALIDVINPADETSGIYVLEEGYWREAKENEIYGYMEQSAYSD